MPSQTVDFNQFVLENQILEAEQTAGASLGAQLVSVLSRTGIPQRDRFTHAANLVVGHLSETGKFYYDSDVEKFSTAMFFHDPTRVLFDVKSDVFKSWLSRLTGINRADKLWDYTLRQIETTALDPETSTAIQPQRYWKSTGDAVYISSGNSDVYKITASGVSAEENGVDDVLFTCGATLSDWEYDSCSAVDPFESCTLFRTASFADAQSEELVRILLSSMPFNPACKPVPALVGGIRSGKTKIVEGVCRLYGLEAAGGKPDDKSDSEFWVLTNTGGVHLLDNVDSHIKWLPDALASASTGGRFEKRKLYTDDETVSFRPRAWNFVTSANPQFASDAGLADRLLVIRMEPRCGATEDQGLMDEIDTNRNSGLSFVANQIAGALADTPPITDDAINRRHPDFSRLALRLGRAAGREAETISALRASEQEKSRCCLENSVVGFALLEYFRHNETLSGTAAEILPQLTMHDPGMGGFISSPRSLGKHLNNLWPHIGEVVDASRRLNSSGTNVYELRSRPAEPEGLQVSPTAPTHPLQD